MTTRNPEIQKAADDRLIQSARNLIKAIREEWMPDIVNRRANEQLRKGDLFRCQLALMMAPMAAEVTTNEELRKVLTETTETVKEYQAALQAEPAKAQA